MAVEIVWSPQAEASFSAIADDIAERFPPEFAEEFVQQIFKAIDQISRFPTAFPKLDRYPEIRCCVVKPNVSIFYQLTVRRQVELISFSQNQKGWGWRD